MGELRNQNIICLAGDDWGSLWTNRQRIMINLSKHNKVLYIESIAIRPPNVTNVNELKKVFKKLKKIFTPIKKTNHNLYLLSPLVIPKYNRITTIINRYLLFVYVKYAQIRLGLKKPILWSYLPHMVWLADKIKHGCIVYHCVDQYAEIPGVNASFLNNLEKRFLKKSDLVFTTSRKLFDIKKDYNNNTFYMPNVADFDHFSKALKANVLLPSDMEMIPRPIFGYIGTLCEHKVNLDLLDYIAYHRPKYSFVIIGPSWGNNLEYNNKLISLGARDNVYILGSRPYELLPQYIKAFDVCLIPHKTSNYMEYSFPLKVFEYMATGKPIVATRFSSLEELSSLIYLSDNEADFLNNIEYALNEQSEKKQLERIHLAKQNTWDIRIAKMESLIIKVLKDKQ